MWNWSEGRREPGGEGPRSHALAETFRETGSVHPSGGHVARELVLSGLVSCALGIELDERGGYRGTDGKDVISNSNCWRKEVEIPCMGVRACH